MVRAIHSYAAPQHHNPVPNAALKGGLLVTSAIVGTDPDTGTFPADRSRQVALAFGHLEAILAEAGAEAQDVVKVDLYMEEKSDRALVNRHWERLWPDPAHRPARHAHQAVLPKGCCLQLVATAVPETGSG